MTLKLDGKTLSLTIEDRLKKDIFSLTNKSIREPSLAVIRVGDDPASGVYIRNKEKACERIGTNVYFFGGEFLLF